MFDFYSSFGQVDEQRNHVGLFRRAPRDPQAADDGDLDLKWSDFVAGNLTPAVAAHEEARAARAAKEAEATVPMDRMIDLPPIS